VPRRPRFDLPGTIHHVCIRGIEGRRIFLDALDAADMTRRFERWICETKSRCHAWSFNGNHVHLLIARGEGSLAELMARFTSAFAQRFNWRHERRGHLFMGRYESRLIRDEDDLRWVVLYASANPVRHQACEPPALDDYRESSWGGLIGKRAPWAFESLELPLSLYGESPAGARQNLREALQLAVEMKWTRPLDVRLVRLIEAACRRQGIDRSGFTTSSARARAAQDEVLLRAIAELGMTWSEAAGELPVSRSRIARLMRRRARSRTE
jgi:REP element-mobilizing transposase RayT